MPDRHPSPSLIVVVEDNGLLRMNAVTLLEDAGYETMDAADADTALHIMRAHWQNVRLLFTDVQMPGDLNGIELAEEVHRCWPDVLLLVTSGDDSFRDDELPDDGQFVSKPYLGSTLIAQVHDLIQKGHVGRPC